MKTVKSTNGMIYSSYKITTKIHDPIMQVVYGLK